jgi:Fe-S oxidoreductase
VSWTAWYDVFGPDKPHQSKTCAGQCPIKVNVPELRSRFLELYHGRYLRPLRDYLIGALEFSIPHFAKLLGSLLAD